MHVLVRRVSKSFGRLEVLKDLDLVAEEQQFVSVVGPSGCGKTTLLRIVGGLIDPTAGTVRVDGDDAMASKKEGAFGFVFQKPVLLPWRTVSENVGLPGELFNHVQLSRTPQEVLETVGLKGFEDVYPRQLSGGMLQKAALARVLLYDPSVLLMDEPFGALDEITRERMNFEFLRIWRARKPTVLFVTHDLREAVLLADKVVVLTDRPATVAGSVQVNLPRPRSVESASLAGFAEALECVRDLVHL